MPKMIKKRAVKKKSSQGDEVKSSALQALDVLKKRQKQIITAVSAVAVIVVLYIFFAFYSSSLKNKAYSLEMEANRIYYGSDKDESASDEDKWKKALEIYKKSIDITTTPSALFYLGNCYFNLGEYEKAIKEYSVFTDKFGGEKGIVALVYQKLASAYFRTGQNDNALETLGKLAKVESGIFRDTALIIEARYHEKAGQKEKALDQYRTILTEFPTSPWSVEAKSKVATDEAESRQAEETSEEPEVKREEKTGEQPKNVSIE